ncbi:MAG: UDP-3-O-(3-hydroxymyristoyl)glucosamine N-acyltransferase, partial [candidate division KSB1 bacterium]|nr:UDP-3-O-(3-hydroxymyristoyl)glucosamine N-acyltransferase [candidate division KSB1 bacterium]
IAGQVGFVGHIEIADDTTFGAQCGVTKSIPPGMTVSGYPAREHMQWRREEAALRRLPELLKRVRALEKALAKIAPEVLEKNGNDDT